MACEILEYSVFPNPNLENFPTLSENFNNLVFMRKTTPEDRIDVCLMMLTMVSYALPKDDLLKEKYTQVIENVTQPILNQKNLLLNCRLTIMLGYYMDILYKKDNDTFLTLLDLFLSSLTSDEKDRALAIQSSDTLNTIINDNDIIPRIVPVLPIVVNKVCECLLTVNIMEFFDFVTEIFKFYKPYLSSEDFFKLFKHTVQRIYNEIQNSIASGIGSKTLKQTMATTKCWHIITSIFESKEYLDSYAPQLENEMKVLLELLQTPENIDFDDDLVKIIKVMIIKSEKVSDNMKVMFS